jgi:hypothetical protein
VSGKIKYEGRACMRNLKGRCYQANLAGERYKGAILKVILRDVLLNGFN